jgi:pimeloyl-ACP methyl ester carboxylesterase
MKKLIPKLIGFYFNMLALLAPRTAGRKGFFFFCTPFGAKIKEHQMNFLKTAEHSSFDLEGTSIQVYKWGSGKKIALFLHGWQSHSFRWKNYIEALPKEEYTIYALDAPAHGLSQGKHLNVVIYSRLVEQFIASTGPVDTIISHSLGSMATVYTLHRLPSLPVSQVIITGMPAEAKNFIQFYQSVLGLWPRTTRAILEFFKEEINHAPDYFSMVNFVATIDTPCLIIHDRHDLEAAYDDILTVHQQWKGAELITTEKLGHNLRSTDVVKMVSNFLMKKEAVNV